VDAPRLGHYRADSESGLRPRLEGTARILGPTAADLVVPLVRRKYGWQRRLLELVSRHRRIPRPAPLYIEITETATDR
jgi:hypothetical protein